MNEDEEEKWRDIAGYEGMYQISNLGRVKSLERQMKLNLNKDKNMIKKEKILKPGKTGIRHNYLGVELLKKSKQKHKYIHRLVAETFIPNPENKPQVNHIDGNKLNNCIKNLEFCSHKHNIQEAWNLNLISRVRKKGKEHHRSIAVIQYDKDGNYIREWECIRQVEKELGIWGQNISKCCKGKYKSCGGFIWKYKV